MVACPPNKLWRSLVSKIKTMLRSAVKCLVVVMVLRLLLTTVHKTREQLVLIPQATPREVWEFMADFSNYKLLNPHLIQWHVLSDSAHKKKQYSVRYMEYFEHIPVMTNTAVGNFTVYQDEDEGDLRISSQHETCLLPWDTWCLETRAENRFRFQQTGTEVAEIINYSCPWLLLPLCIAECETQRAKVLSNLQNTVFSVNL